MTENENMDLSSATFVSEQTVNCIKCLSKATMYSGHVTRLDSRGGAIKITSGYCVEHKDLCSNSGDENGWCGEYKNEYGILTLAHKDDKCYFIKLSLKQ